MTLPSFTDDINIKQINQFKRSGGGALLHNSSVFSMRQNNAGLNNPLILIKVCLKVKDD